MSYQFGYIEERVFRKYIKEDSVVYDLGSYVGEYAKLFASLGKKVYAFEPAQNNYTKLVENTKDISNIVTFPLALNVREYSCQTRFKECNGTEDPSQTINYVRLDDFVDNSCIPAPDVLKCDCEGNETIIFHTLDFAFRNRAVIWLELHMPPSRSFERVQVYPDNPGWLYPDENGYDFNELKKWNYRVIGVKGNYYAELDPVCDYNDLYWEGALIIPEEKWYGI